MGKVSPDATPEEEWQWAVDSMKQIYEHSQKAGVKLAVEPLNRFPQMMQEVLVARVRAAEEAQEACKRALRSKAQALAYLADTRRKMRRIFGPFPRGGGRALGRAESL